ncbi:carboxypeptidase regulatory-like domain-containing protein, partial [bacterium]|nr:carboxypeptidase regulatory-like domain-containing protein [bacterium]
MYVPANVPIHALSAERGYDWYGGPPPADWAYGPTRFFLDSPITLFSGGNDPGNNFNVYPEAVISGTIISGTNLDLELRTYYNRDWIANISNTNTAYVFHNVPPGTYILTAEPRTDGYAVYEADNIRPVDGQTFTHNIDIGSGYTISGDISPVLLQPTRLRLKWRNQGGQIGGGEAYDGFYNDDLSAGAGSYNLNNV